jgi:hypothetical protein
MDNPVILSIALGLALVFAAALVGWQWSAHRRRARVNARRTHGYELIHALKSYSAWSEYQRDQPVTASSLDELTSPESLTRARALKKACFPELSEHLVRLLQAHSRMVEYLWEQNLLRLSQGSGWKPAYQDAQYQQLRGAQEDLIDEMILICRELIGEAGVPWQATGSDFAFSNSLRSKAPAGPA